ncbi:twin transmembrane helix small protein [Asticcacaulis sp. BYS171W]|uniref:Twin transmembrane helix small protein n=1 Tax=Asticcacaulis aquaticus TaxID=2984212 RepID=A0ABT5HS60_9CAUL|nr:twin transmembrane helix small protein [Asticcacaulis aquaticus]MDC7682824.1 twin transmembrane helix small protein [Asticcacaulis aquaticus]
MHGFLFSLSLVALFAVFAVLCVGIYSLFKGGKFGERWSNKLMQLRVLMQAIAIVILCLFAWWSANHSG